MKFMLIKKQRGEGCDFMIGCGMKYEIVDLAVKDVEHAAEKMGMKLAYPDGRTRRDWKDEEVHFALQGQFDLREAWIFPLDSGREIDLDGLRRDHSNWMEKMERLDVAEQEKLDEEHDRSEYERLKKKYGKTGS